MLLTRSIFRALRLAVVAAALTPMRGLAVDASDRYRSPRNPERKIRRTTELIVLHTTEAPARSSLTKVSDRGECHYVVTEEGRIYRIVDRDREAFHAGRSMWNGREDVDKFSVGIECVGYHNKAMSTVQIAAIRDLVKELQSMYAIPDERVICHSHVAYGAPNKWHRHKHRGRKRCGMLFAMPSVRAKLGLKKRPDRDADTRAGRLVSADNYLQRVLYGSIDTMRTAYPAEPTGHTGAHTPSILSWFTDKAAAQTKDPAKHRPANQRRLPVRAPAQRPKTIAELKAGGFILRGRVSKTTSASKIAGRRWNAADTYYTIRNKVISGDKINPSRIENGMGIWTKR
jgi:N-acetylmuramoyl-L-alanine amidase